MFKWLLLGLGLLLVVIGGGIEGTLEYNVVTPILAGIGTAILVATIFLFPQANEPKTKGGSR
jgi:hypothetical protein